MSEDQRAVQSHMKYSVHLYPTVRVKVTGIEANSVAEAMEKAQAAVDLHKVLDRPGSGNIESVSWSEGPNNFVLVDTLNADGEVAFDESQSFDGEGNPLVDGKTLVEIKAAAAVEATLFMKELLESIDTLTGIAEEHGPRTMADLMYLQGAILAGGFIDNWEEDSSVMKIVQELPSGKRWAEFIRDPGEEVECVAQETQSRAG